MTKAVLAIAVVLAAVRGVSASAEIPGVASNRACLRCHRMATMAVRNERTGRVESLAVDPAAFAESNHRRLKCVNCHNREFKWYPHPEEVAGETLECLDCHRGDPKFVKRRFPEIGREVAGSVHVRKLGRSFTCFACHEPHGFRLAGEVPAARVMAANAVCLACHAAPERLSSLTTRAFPELTVTHAFLPSPALHWRKARCLECHSKAGEPDLGHLVLPAKDAVRDCSGCHNRDSMLFTRLYRYQVKESRARLGFVNAALLNDAYVIGATRNLLVDWLALAVVGLTVAGIAVHAFLRPRR